MTTGLLTVNFTSIDPTTLDAPSDPIAGFLPPDDDTGRGAGFVTYTIRPKTDSPTGTLIPARATIVFDTNDPLDTPSFSNTIDADPPTSHVNPLPAMTTAASFTLGWSGSDGAGSGIASYDIFVSDNGRPFAPLLADTTVTSTIFTGQVGHTYRFYSVATDHVGLQQPTSAAADATVTIVQTPPPPPPPPPLVTVKSATLVTNKRHQITTVVVTFTGVVNKQEADSIGTYRLAMAGKHGSFVARNAGVIKLKSAVYNANTDAVALSLRKPFVSKKPAQVLIYGSGGNGLKDGLGRLIDGDRNGRPGGDASVIISGGRARASNVLGTPTKVKRLSYPAVVDRIIARLV